MWNNPAQSLLMGMKISTVPQHEIIVLCSVIEWLHVRHIQRNIVRHVPGWLNATTRWCKTLPKSESSNEHRGEYLNYVLSY